MKKLLPFLFAYCLPARLRLILMLAGGLPTAYSFSQGTWTQKANFAGDERGRAVGFSIGTKGYIGTGHSSATNTDCNDFWEWDQPTDVWTQKADFGGVARSYAVGFSIGTKGYIGTGYYQTNFSQDIWEWDQATNIWKQKTNFSGAGREYAAAFTIGNYGYIGTGYAGVDKQDLWEFDQSLNVWTQKADLGGTIREGAVGFSIGTKGYIGTGYDLAATTYLNDFWEWDQPTNTWTQKASFFGIPRSNAVGFSINTKGYIGTGSTGPGSVAQDFWEWDQATNMWTRKTDLAGPARSNAVGFSIGTKGYIGTGWDIVGKNDLWEFDPSINGVNEINLENFISVYPSPTKGTFKVQCSGFKLQGIEIYNSNGEFVQGKTLNIEQETLNCDLLSYANGIYFLELKTEQGTAVKKIILSR